MCSDLFTHSRWPLVPNPNDGQPRCWAFLRHRYIAVAALLATGDGRSDATHTKAQISVCSTGHGTLAYLRNCIKINDRLFLKHFALGPQGIHCSNNSFDFSHQGMMQLSNNIHINTSLPFRERTPFWIICCNLEITLTCGIIRLGILLRETGISPSIVKDPWVFLLQYKLASIFPGWLLVFLRPLYIYKAIEVHTGSQP